MALRDCVPQLFNDLISLATLTAGEVTEARRVLRARNRAAGVRAGDRRGHRRAHETCDRSSAALRGDEYPLQLSAEWHARYAQAAHDRAVAMLVASLHGPLLMFLEKARQVAPMHGRRGVEEHRALVDAIAGRDTAHATSLMSTHLDRTADRVAGVEDGKVSA